MEYNDFLKRVIDRGLAGARESYAASAHKLRGAIAGFEACRDKNPLQLTELLEAAQKATDLLKVEKMTPEQYWEARCYEAEIEWVCNCVSVSMINMGLKTVIVPPTARAVMLVSEILGVREDVAGEAL